MDPDRRNKFVRYIEAPARRLKAKPNDWVSTKDLWSKRRIGLRWQDFVEFLQWATEVGLIEYKPWDGTWGHIRFSADWETPFKT